MKNLSEQTPNEIAQRYCTMGGYTSCNRDNLYRRAIEAGHREGTLDMAIEDYQKKLEDKYPQGWRYYAGDTCKHGVYIGGEYDCACYKCEVGE